MLKKDALYFHLCYNKEKYRQKWKYKEKIWKEKYHQNPTKTWAKKS